MYLQYWSITTVHFCVSFNFFTWIDAVNYMYMDVMYSFCSDDSGLILYNFTVFQVHNFQAEIWSEGPGSGTSESSPWTRFPPSAAGGHRGTETVHRYQLLV